MKKKKNKILTILICSLFTLAIISCLLAVWLNDLRLTKTGFIILIYIFGINLCLDFPGGEK